MKRSQLNAISRYYTEKRRREWEQKAEEYGILKAFNKQKQYKTIRGYILAYERKNRIFVAEYCDANPVPYTIGDERIVNKLSKEGELEELPKNPEPGSICDILQSKQCTHYTTRLIRLHKGERLHRLYRGYIIKGKEEE